MREVAGVDFGQLGDPHLIVVESLAQRGVKISNRTVVQIRSGRRSGSIIGERYASAQMLTGGVTPVKKDELYEKIVCTAAETRVRQKREPQRYSSNGFIPTVAVALAMASVIVDKSLRMMRIEAAMTAQEGMQLPLLENFQTTVEDFLDRYNVPSRLSVSPSLQRLMQLREYGVVFTPDKFYKFIYKHPGQRFIGMWTTCEVDWLAQFYGYRVQTQAGLSPLDRKVLENTSQGNQGSLIPLLEQQTGVPCETGTVLVHRNALLGRIQIAG